ncbi:hypothetical protein NEAUS04_1411 [Nematocida ausubeli]|uniref:SWIM-type domain-containing protein n=1 Tax=Nematocida ausubeli (strain ATCC PRA-371 / ERTm2) TaxID=1913371 RepID=A0A086J4Y8_NEMA1|nr:uncharacterized protein NESG_00283 [Nematocida ausubeli]KAI5134733.1 hypothetical protein NEAUS06_1266 [Nematocida ausubeli]KAI5136058.1 hypothetical protein NEAUS07_1451 [Nematocida ausubeli]KAI5148943.1 hypothetical protein NEAUS05_1582 [Nematocida ausubeli]KAI5163194.1 hypothetical protein NEAUS04_1411 [Nematocida ausubeli]KFG27206.1 hypothetical protein NESG_00283 [Nematocida ausubeli]
MPTPISLITYAVAGPEKTVQTRRMCQDGIEYFYAEGEYVIIEGNRAGCTCKEYAICKHILSVAKNEYPAEQNILKSILEGFFTHAQ